MLALKVRDEHSFKVKKILRKFHIPYKQEKGSSIFRLLDTYNAWHILVYLNSLGIKAKIIRIV